MIEIETKYLTNLRAIAIIMVVALHVCSYFLNQYSEENLWQWQLVNLLDSGTRICIGLFLMITGALFLKNKIEIKPFLKKRLFRICIPFLFWTIIYSLIEICIYRESIPNTLNKAIYAGASYHFWYIYMLIGIYLFMPILSVFIQNAKKKHIEYYLIMWLITIFADMQIFKNILPDFYLIQFSGFLGYVILGYYLHNLIKKKFTTRKIIYYVICYLFTFLSTYYLTYKNGELTAEFYQYLDINVVIMATCFFLFFKHYCNFNSTILTLISDTSFGIYFLHPIFLNIMEVDKFLFSSIWILHIIIATVIITFISFLCIFILKKLPIAKVLVG